MSKRSSSVGALHQLSFLDDSGVVEPDCVCRSVLRCYICQKPIPCYSTLYYLVGSKRKRICQLCYEIYKQTFDIEMSRKVGK